MTTDGFRLVNGFIDHLQIVTTNNYNIIAAVSSLVIAW
jgi:hypothetical protein